MLKMFEGRMKVIREQEEDSEMIVSVLYTRKPGQKEVKNIPQTSANVEPEFKLGPIQP